MRSIAIFELYEYFITGWDREEVADELETFDEVVDALVVGSGAAGMVAALTLESQGLKPVLIEKSQYFGGSTARSGGGVWVPNAPQLVEQGEVDDPDEVRAYLTRLAGDRVSQERIDRYLDQAPEMMSFLRDRSPYLADGFFWIRGYSDYHPELGGNPLGRGLWATPIDKRLLGDDMAWLHPGVRRMQLPLGAWITSVDLHDLLTYRWGGLSHKKIFGKLAWRILRARVLGERMGVSGQALITRLRLALGEHGIPLQRNTPLRELITDASGRVTGAVIERDGRPVRVESRHGVVLASGGFDHNDEMRHKYQPELTQDWSLGAATNEGDGILEGERLEADLDLMEDRWWMPTMPSAADGSLVGLVAERQYPNQFVVNGAGKRFVNEATPYVVFCQAQIAGQRSGVGHIPAWMILDSRAWKRNVIAGHLPLTPFPKPWKKAGTAHRADTLAELAGKIDVPADELEKTAARFNRFAESGVDEDFHRGENAYDNYYGDPSLKNPNLMAVDRGPFYALALNPGDLGTKGGLMTDIDGRVVDADGRAIPGLYAAGNVSSSVMGTKYAGPGSTLGPAMTFGYLAGLHISAEAGVASDGR